jgi:mannosyltransferase OCH1-like enzyme
MYKTIFQTWKEEPTCILKQCAESWKEHNPGWRYIFLNDSQLSAIIKKINPGIYYKYETSTLPIKKFDAYRYAYIYEFGGLYADIDILCHKSIDSLISQSSAVLFQEYPCTETFSGNSIWRGDVITNSIFYFKPKDKFLKRLLYDLENYTDTLNKNLILEDNSDYDNLSVIVETGPLFLTKTFNKYRLLNSHVIVESHNRFEYYSKDKRKQMTIKGSILANFESYGTHLNVGSWVTGEKKPFSYYSEVSDITGLSVNYV